MPGTAQLSSRHVFHTKHDFSPLLGWAAFGLLAQLSDQQPITTEKLATVARLVGSPLVVRADLNKLLGALHEVGLVEREHHTVVLSPVGRALAQGMGRYEDGFHKAVHCLYAWQWLWESDRERCATPSWSYREVCRQLHLAGTSGLDRDDLVLRVIAAAQEQFDVESVSFSRASLSGVLMWLEAQCPPLISVNKTRVAAASHAALSPASLALHLAALCRAGAGDPGQALWDAEALRLLAEVTFMPATDLTMFVLDLCAESSEFLLLNGGSAPRLFFRDSDDQFLRWVGGK